MRQSFPARWATLHVDNSGVAPWCEQTGAASSLGRVVVNVGRGVRVNADSRRGASKPVLVSSSTFARLSRTRGAGREPVACAGLPERIAAPDMTMRWAYLANALATSGRMHGLDAGLPPSSDTTRR